MHCPLQTTTCLDTISDGVRLATRQHGQHLWLTAQADDTAACLRVVGRELANAGAWVLQERIFSGDTTWRAERIRAYGERHDLVPPVVLGPPAGRSATPAVIVHALIAPEKPVCVELADQPIARRWATADGGEHLAVTALMAARPGEPPEHEASAVFAQLQALLARSNATLRNVARTWIWMDDILAWYPAFNRARNETFRHSGLVMPDGGAAYLPASTGIGVRPSAGRIALEAIASVGGALPDMHEAAGNQRSAFLYGSAFSRASRLLMGDAPHLFVSGTAAIDREGRTVAIGDPMAQAVHTLANTRAVLADHGCTDEDVLQATVYAATPAAADAWRAIAPHWPTALVMADVCRENLLIESEVVARVG